jgi:hypothetical protein
MNPQKAQHVAGLLRFVLRAKSLTINTCCGVAGFSDLSINLAVLAIFDH